MSMLGGILSKSVKRNVLLAIIFGLIVFVLLIGGTIFGNVHDKRFEPKLVAWLAAGLLLFFGVLFIRKVAHLSAQAVEHKTIPSAGNAVKIILSALGYVLVLFMVFEVLDISVEKLLVGGALTGVIVGIAAQQALGNVFAGLVLLLARPFVVGEHIKIRSGSLGGIMDGYVVAMSLTYVSLHTEGILLKIPNSVMLAAAVGPFPEQEHLTVVGMQNHLPETGGTEKKS